MAVPRVAEVQADTLAAAEGTPVSELLAQRIAVPLWAVVAWRTLAWPVRNPLETAALAPGAYMAVWSRSMTAGLLVASGIALVILAGQLYWDLRRAAVGATFREIISGRARRRAVVARWADVCYKRRLTARSASGAMLVPSLRDFRIDQSGLTAHISTMALAEDSTVLAKHAPGLAAGLGCDRVVLDLDSNRGGTIAFQWGRHLRREFRIPDIRPTGTWQRVAFGIDERGGPVSIPANKSALIVAESGAGKSNAAWAILSGYIRDVGPESIRVRILDPGELEFAALKERLESGGKPGICHQYVTSTAGEDLKRFWGNIDRALDARRASVAKAGVREHVPTPAEPLDITVIDETLLVAGDLKSKGPEHTAGRVAFVGRKYGFAMLALSQAGQVDALGRIRDLFPTRIAFRTGSAAMTDAVLGDGATARGARCHELDEARDRGVGYISYGGRPRAFRAALVSDADTKWLARGELPPSAAQVAEAREYRTTWVYRHYGTDRDGRERLLYVGITNDLEKRQAQHAADKPWMQPDSEWANVRVETRDSECFPRRSLAETQEALVIAREAPLYNDQFNRDNPDRVNWRAKVSEKAAEWWHDWRDTG